MKKILFIVISICIGIGLIPVILATVDTASRGDYSIEYTITSTSGTITHNLSNTDFDYIYTNLLSVSNHTLLEFLTSGEDAYVSIADGTTYFIITFANAEELTYTLATRVITSTGTHALVEGGQAVTIYFEGVPVTNTITVFLSLVPLIFIASILGFIFLKRKDED